VSCWTGGQDLNALTVGTVQAVVEVPKLFRVHQGVMLSSSMPANRPVRLPVNNVSIRHCHQCHYLTSPSKT
jgi:hypothetical protein